MNRREAIATAAALGAALAWPSRSRAASRDSRPGEPRERGDAFPQGVASGDPLAHSVLLWTRRPPVDGSVARRLTVEIAEDHEFRHVVSRASAPLSADADWTCRVLAAGLAPASVYWYRFTDDHGLASRLGRTVTAPVEDDDRVARFAFVSCQNNQQGACNAYRRMVAEDEQHERDEPNSRLDFVLHLGDFVYEIVWYPEDRPQGMYDRKLKDLVRYPHGEKHADFHVPTTVDDYRALYRGYLSDPDLQDARARWPFVCMWDNHEFSWRGWQSQEDFGSGSIGAQSRKVAASRTWWEYQPARVTQPGAAHRTVDLQHFRSPAVTDATLPVVDDHGLGRDPSNLAAIGSLELRRALRWGRHVELLLTDNRSFRSEPVMQKPESAPFKAEGFPYLTAQDALVALDAGRAHPRGAPESIRFAGKEIPNPRRSSPPQSMLGAVQKAWFLDALRRSRATWKLWGNSVAMLDWRVDVQNLPAGVGSPWPGGGYAQLIDDDWSGYRAERNEILDVVRHEGIAGFVCIAGDRHAFTAGLLSPTLPPDPFEPVGLEFITGSISAPGVVEGATYGIPKSHPLRGLYLHDAPAGGSPIPAINLTLRHGVRASLALERSGAIGPALAERNADVAPHLKFVDLGGHGYAVVTAGADAIEVEFVCIPRPVARNASPDGGPLLYRVSHRARRWAPGVTPVLEQLAMEGVPPLSP